VGAMGSLLCAEYHKEEWFISTKGYKKVLKLVVFAVAI
jgi:hypothetical protein